MGFEALSFQNFRNIKDGEVAVPAPQVFLVSENGQGKTNFLEAVHLLCVAGSFRDVKDQAFARDRTQAARVAGVYTTGIETTRYDVRVSDHEKKEIRINEKFISDRRELLGQVICVCFVQQDMDLVCGPPEARRRFFDQTLLLSHLSFLDVHRDYRRVLRSRNAALKQGQESLLDLYDTQLAALGLLITAARRALVDSLSSRFSSLVRKITGWSSTLRIRYSASWGEDADVPAVLQRLTSSRNRDLSLGTTTSGPHRDIFAYSFGDEDFVPKASTGERRLCALVLRVAQSAYLSDAACKPPVLLVDDVLLELDPERKIAFISNLPPYEQAFFTLLPGEDFSQYARDGARVLRVKSGGFSPW